MLNKYIVFLSLNVFFQWGPKYISIMSSSNWNPNLQIFCRLPLFECLLPIGIQIYKYYVVLNQTPRQKERKLFWCDTGVVCWSSTEPPPPHPNYLFKNNLGGRGCYLKPLRGQFLTQRRKSNPNLTYHKTHPYFKKIRIGGRVLDKQNKGSRHFSFSFYNPSKVYKLYLSNKHFINLRKKNTFFYINHLLKSYLSSSKYILHYLYINMNIKKCYTYVYSLHVIFLSAF